MRFEGLAAMLWWIAVQIVGRAENRIMLDSFAIQLEDIDRAIRAASPQVRSSPILTAGNVQLLLGAVTLCMHTACHRDEARCFSLRCSDHLTSVVTASRSLAQQQWC